MSRIWRTVKGYLFWTYDRGSFHYDVMVSLILVFIFVAPGSLISRISPGTTCRTAREPRKPRTGPGFPSGRSLLRRWTPRMRTWFA